MSNNKGLDEETMENYWAISKGEIIQFAITWTEVKGIMRTEVNQKNKDEHKMISFIWGT